MIGTAASTAGFAWLLLAHARPWELIVAAIVLGGGTGFAFASMVNLVIESVPSEQTGIATGTNILMRTLGGTIGTQLAATMLAATLAPDGLTTRRGFEIAFADRRGDARARDGCLAGSPARPPARGAARPARTAVSAASARRGHLIACSRSGN